MACDKKAKKGNRNSKGKETHFQFHNGNKAHV